MVEGDLFGKAGIEAFLYDLAGKDYLWLKCVLLGLYHKESIECVLVEDLVEFLAGDAKFELG